MEMTNSDANRILESVNERACFRITFHADKRKQISYTMKATIPSEVGAPSNSSTPCLGRRRDKPQLSCTLCRKRRQVFFFRSFGLSIFTNLYHRLKCSRNQPLRDLYPSRSFIVLYVRHKQSARETRPKLAAASTTICKYSRATWPVGEAGNGHPERAWRCVAWRHIERSLSTVQYLWTD
jgi:hypothetical protein